MRSEGGKQKKSERGNKRREERKGSEERKRREVISSSVTILHLLCGGTVTTQPIWLGHYGNNQSNHGDSGHTARAGSRDQSDFLLTCKCAAVLN